MMNQMAEFDAMHSPLQTGVNLIEASAGTGKTYTIAMLVLRFIVEHGFDIKELLVVTFTKAATEELKDRIRKRLSSARLAIKQASDDEAFNLWLNQLPLDKETVLQRLELALLDIDLAPIFTIHGFCQRVLTEHAMESGQMFETELTNNTQAIRQSCADDFWRKQLYPRPVWQVALLTSVYASPDALLESLKGINLHQTVYPVMEELDANLVQIDDLIKMAQQSLPDLLKILDSAVVVSFFNDKYLKKIESYRFALTAWLNCPETQPIDFSWLTSAGLQEGLNGRKFMQSKTKPLPSQEQKTNYLAGLGLLDNVFDQLETAMLSLQVNFRCQLLKYLRTELDKSLQKHNVLSFDDLIFRLNSALQTDKAEKLINVLRQRYKIALLDEFQDTDHKQWQIFSQIFAVNSHFLFLIGDPKQAIYKFRGADIFSYFAAHSQASYKYSLAHNWRSHPDLVTGINRLFERQQPFLFENLNYQAVYAARQAAEGEIGDLPPMILWQLDKQSDNLEHWSAGKAAEIIKQNVVSEILAVLTEGVQLKNTNGNRAIQPKDIAILVRRNKDALEYQSALTTVGIPSVINNKHSVFNSLEAMDLYSVLQAIAQPGNLTALKQALTVSWFSFDGQQLYQLSHDEHVLMDYLNRFQNYHESWQKQGFLFMMRCLLEQEKVAVNLCAQPQAERKLTNLQHILERVQQAAIDKQLSITKTLEWLKLSIQQALQDNNEDSLLRLESDEESVKIVTLHSAKGLEYPLVFCPNLWQLSDKLRSETELVQCHEDGEIIADLGSEIFQQRHQQALFEELAEDLRLCYVAVTRAKYRCYVVWGDVRTKEKANNSGLAYLFAIADASFTEQQGILQSLATAEPKVFHYQLIAEQVEQTDSYQINNRIEPVKYRVWQTQLQTDWLMSSYTALAMLSTDEVPELPEDKLLELPEATDPEPTAAYTELPKGAKTGNVVHSILEKGHFKELATNSDISHIRDTALSRFGLKLNNTNELDKLIKTVVTTPLSEEVGFRLENLSEQHCIKEMPFYLNMKQMDVSHINLILSDCPAYQALSRKQMTGYLTGFIDLVCTYQGKFYVMDYKTNSLTDYTQPSLLSVMRQHNYGLQYWLYSLVVHKYLQLRMPNYEYDLHFGGVKYLFVRGMGGKQCEGVFTDLPDRNKIIQLEDVFFNE